MLTQTDKEYIKKGCHDISNIISLINGNYQLLEITEPALRNNRRFEQLGENIHMLIDAMSSISLYRYSDNVEPVPVNPSDFIRQILEDIKSHDHTSMLKIDFTTDTASPMIYADIIKVTYIINAIMDNVADIKTSALVFVEITHDDANVYINITDTLPEFDAAALMHLFEPFNTCKSDHIGLSLASSRNIMRALSGDLTRSTPCGGGSTFTLRFPVIP